MERPAPLPQISEGSQSDTRQHLVHQKLQKLVLQLEDLNNSEPFQGRYELSAKWKMNEWDQEAFVLIGVNAVHIPETVSINLLPYVPSFHLIALAAAADDVDDAKGPACDLVIRLFTFNGFPASKLDEKYSAIAEDLSKSSLLLKYATGRLTLCCGLTHLPKHLERTLLSRSQVLRERFKANKVVWRSTNCCYVMEMSDDGILYNCCHECSSLIEGAENVLEPHDEDKTDQLDQCHHLDSFTYDELLHSISNSSGYAFSRLQKLQTSGLVVLNGSVDLPRTAAPDCGSQVSDVIYNVTVTAKQGDEEKQISMENIHLWRQQELQEMETLERKSDKLKPCEKRKREPTETSQVLRVQNHVKKCPICQEPFSDVNLFMAHLSKCNVSSEEEVEEIVEDSMELDQNGQPKKQVVIKKRKKKRKSFPMSALSCGICGQTFKFDTHYEPHVKAHEERLHLDVEVTCPLCKETLASKRHLNPHFKKSHPSDGGCCVECLKVMDVSLLKQHLQKQHQQTKATSSATGTREAIKSEGHLCPDCGKKCQYLSELEIHMAIQHMGIALERPPIKEEEVMCHECGKVFNHRYRLKQHLSTTHNKSRDHPCPFCPKVFCLKHQLTKHLLTHSDVKPFKCKYCDYQNVRKYRVLSHCQKAHHVVGTDHDIQVMEGGAKPSEFVHNVFGM